jgi:large subunit ribosomal protein L29
MEYAELATLSGAELKKRIKDTRATMFEARMKNALGQLANPMVIRQGRREVARLQTALNSKRGAK